MVDKKISMIIPDFMENKQVDFERILNEHIEAVFCELIVVTEQKQFFNKNLIKKIPVSIIEQKGEFLHSLNKAFEVAQGELLYVQSVSDSLDIGAVKRAAKLISDNYDKINISFFPQNKEDSSDMVEGLYHVMLEQKFVPGVFNFVIKKEYSKLDETLVPRASYLKFIIDAMDDTKYYGYTKQGYQKHLSGIFDPYRYEAVNSYESYCKYYDFLLEYMDKKCLETKHAPWLIQVLLIKSLDEVLMKNSLIPENYTADQKVILKRKIQQIIDLVEVKALLASGKIGRYHLVYLFTFRSNGMVVRSDAGRFGLYDGENKLFSWNKLGFYISGIEKNAGKVYIKGSFQNPISSFVTINYFLGKNGETTKIQTKDCKISYRNTPQKISDCQEYILEVSVDEDRENYFEAEVLNNKFPITIIYDKAKEEDHGEKKVVQIKEIEVIITCHDTIQIRKLSFLERCKLKFFS